MFIGKGSSIYGNLNPRNDRVDQLMDSIGGNENSLVPMVLQRVPGGERSFDLFSLMLNQRIIFMHEGVSDGMASIITASLLYLESERPGQDISLYINSPGGSVISGLAIYDTMQYITSPVATICMGMAASMGLFLLNAGTKGMRAATRSARIMGHMVSSGSQGQILDQRTQWKETEFLNEYLLARIAEHCGQPLEKVKADFDRDFWMNPQEAVEYGIIDRVIKNAGEVSNGGDSSGKGSGSVGH